MIVIGDFNVDFSSTGEQVISLFKSRNLHPALDLQTSSSDGCTHIDSCFTNIKNIKATFYESTFSYHKPILVTWEKNEDLVLFENVQSEAGVEDIEQDNQDEVAQSFNIDIPKLIASDDPVNFSTDRIQYCQSLLQKVFRAKTATAMRAVLQEQNPQNHNFLLEIANNLGSRELHLYQQQNLDTRSQAQLGPRFDQHRAVETSGYGNCFYCAISISLFGSDRFHGYVRLAILLDMLDNEEGYSNFFRATHQDENMYNNALLNTSSDKEWAEEIALYATSKILQRPVTCYSSTVNRLVLFDEEDSTRDPLCLHFRDGCHFVAILRLASDVPSIPCEQDELALYRKFAL